MLSILLTILLATEPFASTVAFVGYTESVSQIYLLDIGSDTTTAIGPPHVRGPLRWSPDGQWLACTVESASGSVVCLIPADGSDPVFIDHAEPYNQFPRWHSSGNKLAYQSGTFPDTTISVYDLATKTETTWGGESKGLMRPVWLNTQSFISTLIPSQKADTLNLDHTGGLVAVQLVAVDKEWTTQLTAVSMDKAHPLPKNFYDYPDEQHTEWAIEPGAKDRSFVYESNDGGDREIFLVNKGRPYDLSNHRAADINPVCSPDGKWVAFESYRGARRGIYRGHRDSGRVLPILESDTVDFFSPSWSPDGLNIVCVRQQNETSSLLVYGIKTNDSQHIPLSFTSIEHPAWKP